MPDASVSSFDHFFRHGKTSVVVSLGNASHNIRVDDTPNDPIF